MSKLRELIKGEPVAFFGVIQGLVAAVILTVHWLSDVVIPTEISAAWLAFVALFLGFVTRSKVTPWPPQ